MTTANKITISRSFLIPIFVTTAMYYGKSVEQGEPVEGYRQATAILFLVCAIGDGIDGYVARRFNQQSKLGVLLDPLVDKCMILSAIITLSLTSWPVHFPLWFPVIVIAKDVLSIAAAFLIKHIAGKVEIHPHWMGKVATTTQIVAISWIMLQLPHISYPTWIAGFFTVGTGAIYIFDAARQISAAEVTKHPDSHHSH